MGIKANRVTSTKYWSSDLLDDPLGDLVEVRLWLQLRLNWPVCLPSVSTLAFLFPPAICPSPTLLPESRSITVVLGRPSCFAMALMLSCSFGGFPSFAAHNTLASSIFSSFHLWFFWFLWLMASFFSWGVLWTFPPCLFSRIFAS